MPAVMKAIGTFLKHLGIGANSSFSLIEAKIKIAIKKPSEEEKENMVVSKNPYSLFETARIAIPKIAQFVVIKGR